MEQLTSFIERNPEQLEFLILQLVSCLRYENPKIKKSKLLKFLICNVSKSTKLASKFYWNVKIESQSHIPAVAKLYTNISDEFWFWIAGDTDLPEVRDILAYQMGFRDILSEAFEEVLKHSGSSKAVKKQKLREFLKDRKADMEKYFENDNFFVFKGGFLIIIFIRIGMWD